MPLGQECSVLLDGCERAIEAASHWGSSRSEPRPKVGRAFIRASAEQNLQECPVGSVGRKRQLLVVVALLRLPVTRYRADRWMPPFAELITDLIADAARHHQDSTPIKPDQLAALLDALRNAGRDDPHLAVKLVGMFGLRQVELGVLRVEEGGLYLGNAKRSARILRFARQERRAVPLGLPGREG
jgi:hypothetical protein